MQTERKVMTFTIPIEDIINSVLPMKDWTRVVENNLPEGTRILDVQVLRNIGCFEFLIHHPDFEEVCVGCVPKRLTFILKTKRLSDVKDQMFSEENVLGRLHRHIKLEQELQLDDNHVIVDKKDWWEVCNFLKEE